MFSEDVVGLVEEMGFRPSSELSSTDGCWAEVDREGIPDDWCCNVEAPPTELSSGPWLNLVSTSGHLTCMFMCVDLRSFYTCRTLISYIQWRLYVVDSWTVTLCWCVSDDVLTPRASASRTSAFSSTAKAAFQSTRSSRLPQPSNDCKKYFSGIYSYSRSQTSRSRDVFCMSPSWQFSISFQILK